MKESYEPIFRRSRWGFQRGFRGRAGHFAQPRAQAIPADSATVRRTPARYDSHLAGQRGKVSTARHAREKKVTARPFDEKRPALDLRQSRFT